MDEVFDSSLDQNATDYLMNIIRDVAKDNNIVIISHKEHMNEKFNNTIRFKKVKNFSTIE
jgi:DNA repair exonuclease SbcCD ATPase subunit